jgi:hypothetical protein
MLTTFFEHSFLIYHYEALNINNVGRFMDFNKY